MLSGEATVVPLDAVHEVLSVFGIGPENREYQRWRRDDGFRLVDLEDVLGHSQFVLSVDWREALPDALSVTRLLIESGTDVNARANIYGGSTALGLLVTSDHPAKAGVRGDLRKVLLDAAVKPE